MPVRADLADAHRVAWEHIAAPGTWWSGAERVELARTALRAIADPDPPPPWIPVSSTGRLPSNLIAPLAAHDVMFRITRHAGTMTESVYRAAADELGELPYVELCAISSTVAAVAHFCRNIGEPVPPLPRTVGGQPARQRPERLATARPSSRRTPRSQPSSATRGGWPRRSTCRRMRWSIRIGDVVREACHAPRWSSWRPVSRSCVTASIE